MPDKLKSRKLWVTILGIAIGMFYPPALPLVKVLAPAYVGSEALVDALRALNGHSK